MPRKKFSGRRAFSQLETHVAPRDLDPALGLLYQWGITTTQTRRERRAVYLCAELPKGFRFAAFRTWLSRRRKSEGGRVVFHGLRRTRILDRSWIDKYKEHLRPFSILPKSAGAVLKVDPRGKVPRRRDPDTLYIEAGLAFGTGTHATTQLAAELLAEAIRKSGARSVLDVGCGTGILAMAARKLGVRRVAAVDNDPEAIAVARENFRRNRLRGASFAGGISAVRGQFPVIVSNIGLNVLRELRSELLARLAPRGYLILTGLLYKDRAPLRRAYAQLRLVRAVNRRGWSAFLLRKP